MGISLLRTRVEETEKRPTRKNREFGNGRIQRHPTSKKGKRKGKKKKSTAEKMGPMEICFFSLNINILIPTLSFSASSLTSPNCATGKERPSCRNRTRGVQVAEQRGFGKPWRYGGFLLGLIAPFGRWTKVIIDFEAKRRGRDGTKFLLEGGLQHREAWRDAQLCCLLQHPPHAEFNSKTNEDNEDERKGSN